MRLLVAITATTATLVAAGLALALTPTHQALIDTTVRYLQETQDASGGFAEPGGKPSQGISAWVALALASAGINPQDQARCGASAFEYLEGHFREGLEEELAWPLIAITSFERELLVVDASGTDPHDFAGYDLVAEILRRQLPDGSFPYVPEGKTGESNDTIFAILALGPIHEPEVEEAIAAAREWVVAAQLEDGGWYYSGSSPHSEVDMTGAAIEALVAAGPPTGEPALGAYEEAIAAGLGYLERSQLADGGFPARPSGERESNVASTAWAVQAIWSVGQNPEDWTTEPEGREPLDYMESMQQPDGHIRWRASSDMNGIWMTAYVTPAFDGQALPIPLAARGDPRAAHGEATACLETGRDGGGAPGDEAGVISGGGGQGAPAFSRPKAQSEGRTPGGARLVHGRAIRSRDHSRSRRGENAAQARGAETKEPRRKSEADQEAPSVGHDSSTSGALAAAGDGGDDGRGPGARGAPIAAEDPTSAASATTGEEVSGVVIGSPDGKGDKLAFGAPGLRTAGGGRGEGGRLAIAIAAAAVLAALGGLGWERRRQAALG
ncbi:MAG TPA: prenyltransferase/squalene oxidase repeat-containing protein [Solirubrobacterales bacterium]|nr:prenyltransferase/squalene oxidase repeat-containing protein [Solirubrobacterales bacterium]